MAVKPLGAFNYKKMGESEKTNVLSKRMNKILDSRIENDQDTIEALRELSTFYTENTLQARRNLRSQIEKRNLDINQHFLDSFRVVKDSFASVYTDISEMNTSIQEMTHQLHNAKSQTKKLLQETSALQVEYCVYFGLIATYCLMQDAKERIETHQDVTRTFLQEFQLQQEDLVALYGDAKKLDRPITFDTFRALAKVQNIHENCKVLMQAGLQTLALDIMEQMTMHQEGTDGNLTLHAH